MGIIAQPLAAHTATQHQTRRWQAHPCGPQRRARNSQPRPTLSRLRPPPSTRFFRVAATPLTHSAFEKFQTQSLHTIAHEVIRNVCFDCLSRRYYLPSLGLRCRARKARSGSPNHFTQLFAAGPFGCHRRRCFFSPAFDGCAFALGLHPDLLA